MTLLYFAWVRQKVGKGEETMVLPPEVRDVRGLIAHLRTLGAGYNDALADEARLRVAVNQRHVGFDASVGDGDEIALFPPVTGGAV